MCVGENGSPAMCAYHEKEALLDIYNTKPFFQLFINDFPVQYRHPSATLTILCMCNMDVVLGKFFP